mgnify:CR=1 FL=1
MLIIFAKIVIIVGLLRYLDEIGEPLQCAGIFTGGAFVLSLLFGISFSTLLFLSVIRFALSTMYFYALHYLVSGPLYWLVAIVGFFVVLI